MTIQYLEKRIEELEKRVKALEQEPCNKLSQECVEPTQKHVGNALKMRCDDAVSREAVVDDFIEWREEIEYAFGEDYSGVHLLNVAIQKIWDMPSVTQKPIECNDVVSRQAVLKMAYDMSEIDGEHFIEPCMVVDVEDIQKLPSVRPQEHTGYCKECKYFEYDSMAKVDGVPLIVAHEICSKWGDGCKTKEDGYCFLFEPQKSEE